jgi:RHS repeat-associated protein
VSGLIATARPRRIKAAHRRRRKAASGQSVQRYYDPGIGRFLSVDPVTAYDKPITNFNRYIYALSNPYRFTDPDGRDALTGLGGVLQESVNALNGHGFDGQMVAGAFKDGYNGEGDGFAAAALNDATAIASLVGGAGLARLAVKEERIRVVVCLAISCSKVDPAVPRDAVTGEVKRTPTSQVLRDLEKRRQNKEAPIRERKDKGEQRPPPPKKDDKSPGA